MTTMVQRIFDSVSKSFRVRMLKRTASQTMPQRTKNPHGKLSGLLLNNSIFIRGERARYGAGFISVSFHFEGKANRDCIVIRRNATSMQFQRAYLGRERGH